MSLNSRKILGIHIATDNKETILEEVKKWLVENNGKPRIIVTPNAEQLVFARQNMRFAGMLNRADVAIPDGFPVSRLLHVPRIPGVEFMEDLVRLAAKRGDTIGLIGGYGGLAVRALECLKATYPGLRGWAIEPEGYSLQQIVQKIRKTNTRFVFVGLGAPKQEYFIARMARESQSIYMSVGGAFDMISGTIQRAPVPIRKVGLEWLWRLFQEPWRWKRQLALVKFAVLVIAEKVRTV